MGTLRIAVSPSGGPPGLRFMSTVNVVGVNKHVLLADQRPPENAEAAAETLANAGYDVSVAAVDVSSPDDVGALVQTATGLGDVTGLIHAAGVQASQAPPSKILQVDLYGTAPPRRRDAGQAPT